MKRLLLLLLASALTFSTYAQLTNCTQTLRLARSYYEQGRLHEIPGFLEKCLQSGFSQQEKVEAYKLLCLSYIYLEEPAKADEAMLALLRTDNYFEINPSADPAEFIALYKTFRTTPVYRIGASIGANASQPNVVSYTAANAGESKYGYGFGFQGSVLAEVPLKKRLTLTGGLNFALKNFTYENKSAYTEIESQEPRTFTISATEKQTWVSLPVIVQYKIFESKFNPYIAGGFSADYLLNVVNNFSRTKEKATSLDEQSVSLKDYRNAFNASALAAIGAKLKVTGGFAFVEVRYSYGLTKLNSDEDIFTLDPKTFPTSGYVDGIFKMNTLSVSIGYVYNKFNPKKLNK